MENLFIYGTLAPGQINHHKMSHISGKWLPATTKGKLFEAGWGASCGCPGMIPDDNGTEIEGYVFCSDELKHHWQHLDEFEGVEYQRVLIKVKLENNVDLDAYVYKLSKVPESETK